MTEPNTDSSRTPLDSGVIRALLAGLPISVLLLRQIDPEAPTNFVVEYANPAAAQALGTNATNIIGRKLWELPDTLQSGRLQVYAEVLQSGRERAIDDFYTPVDGVTPAWLSVRAFPISTSLLGLVLEIVTTRRMNEERLVRSERFLNSVLENLPEMVFVKDAVDLRFVRFNKAGEALLGHSRDDLIGKNDYDFFPKEEANFFVAKDREVLASRTVLDIPEEPIHTAARGTRFLHTKKIPIVDERGEPLYLLGISHDVTEQKRAAEALILKTRELARSNAELEQFAYVASHDLQEPIRKILTFGDRLKATLGDALDAQNQDDLDRMLGAATRMRALVEDLLSLSRVTTSGLPFVNVDLAEVVSDVLSDLDEARQRVQGIVEVSALPSLEGDPVQLRQLVQNLIGNALKFHAPGHCPRVQVEAARIESAQGPKCELRVRDDGIGFDEKFVDRVFAPFQRLHPRSEYDGTGMGLAICRRIVERHGGMIAASSRPGEGSVFTVQLPLCHQSSE